MVVLQEVVVLVQEEPLLTATPVVGLLFTVVQGEQAQMVMVGVVVPLSTVRTLAAPGRGLPGVVLVDTQLKQVPRIPVVAVEPAGQVKLVALVSAL